jgi:hypothetical protein
MHGESTILIRNRTRERLKQLGKKGQTYDELIDELIKLRGNSMTSLDNKVTTKSS